VQAGPSAPPTARPAKPSAPRPSRPKPSRPDEPPTKKAPRAEPAPEPPRPKPRPKPVRPEEFAWAFPEEPRSEGLISPLSAAPAVDETGRVFVHLNQRLYALEESDGEPKICWEYVTGSRAPGPVVVAPDGTLRLHCSDGSLHCLTFEGKQVYMPASVGEPLGYAAPVADADGNTWISAVDGGLIKIDADGKSARKRYFRSRQKLNAPGVIHQGALYIGSEDGYLFAIRLDDRSGTNLFDHVAEQGYTGWYIHSWPAVSEDGNLIVAGRDECLYGFAASGKLLWKTEIPGQMLASPVIDRQGQIYVGVSQSRRGQDPRGLLVCVDGNSHKIRWQHKAAGPVESTAVIGDDDVIYFGDNTGRIHAVDFQAKVRFTAKVGSPVRSAGTILGPNRVAFGLDDETLIVLKCSSASLAKAGWPKIGKTLGQCGLC